MENKVSKEEQEKAELECLEEVKKVLVKHKCGLTVNFTKELVLGNEVLKYTPSIIYTGT